MKIERRSKRFDLHPKTFTSGPLTQSINTQHVQVRNRHPLPLAVTLIGNHALALQILKVTTKAPTIRSYSLYGTKRNYIHLRAWCCGHNFRRLRKRFNIWSRLGHLHSGPRQQQHGIIRISWRKQGLRTTGWSRDQRKLLTGTDNFSPGDWEVFHLTQNTFPQHHCH